MLVIDLSQCYAGRDGTLSDDFAPILEPITFVDRPRGPKKTGDVVQRLPLLQAGQKGMNLCPSSDASSVGDEHAKEEDADSPPVSPNGSPTVTLQSRQVVQRLKRKEKAAMDKTAAEICQ